MYQNTGNQYFGKWAKKFPYEIDSKKICFTCINSRGELFLQTDRDMDTICYDNNLQKQYTLHHKGRLVDSIDGELFYVEKFGNKQYKMVVHKENHSAEPASHKATSQKEDLSQPLTLLPQWKVAAYNPSVCRVQQYYVVVDGKNKALDVFDLKGKHLLHRDLDYYPAYEHAITTTTSGHILVTSFLTKDAVHIYTPQGDHVGTLDLGLQEDKDIKYIVGIKCSNDGLLHVLAGGHLTLTDLFVYTIE